MNNTETQTTNMDRSKISGNKGFTLVELLIVIAIISISMSFLVKFYVNHLRENQPKERPAITEKYEEKGNKFTGDYE